jgi:hypothetical protein
MTWVKVDDRAPWHEKLRGLSDAAFGVWVKGLCHCSLHETDGVIHADDLSRIGHGSARNQLLKAGLWVSLADGSIQIHDYLQHQRSRKQISNEKAKARERSEKSRSVRRTYGVSHENVTEPDTDTDTDTDTEHTQSVKGLRGKPPAAPIERALFESIHTDLANDGHTIDQALTRDEAGTLRRVANDLLKVGATPDEVHRRVAVAHATWSPGRVTVNAVGNNWAGLVTTPVEPSKPRLLRCPEHDAPIIHGVCQACKYSNVEAI